MMILIKLTTINSKCQWNSFSFQSDDLEAIYEVLHTIVQRGDTLVNVTWLDAHGCLPLPLDAFEKTNFLNPIEALRQQWEELLTHSVGYNLPKDDFKQQFIELREDRIGLVRRRLSYIQELIERTHQHLKDGFRKTRLLTYYQRMLDRYSRLLIKLETASHQVAQRPKESGNGESSTFVRM